MVMSTIIKPLEVIQHLILSINISNSDKYMRAAKAGGLNGIKHLNYRKNSRQLMKGETKLQQTLGSFNFETSGLR